MNNPGDFPSTPSETASSASFSGVHARTLPTAERRSDGKTSPLRKVWNFVCGPILLAAVLLIVLLGLEANAVVNHGLSMDKAREDSVQMALCWPLAALGLVILKGFFCLKSWAFQKGGEHAERRMSPAPARK